MTVETPAGHASVVVQRRVEWPDTDAAGHYHHSTVVRWVEAAEAVLYERLGLLELFGRIPRVRYEVDYRARLWFGDRVEISLGVAELGRTSIRYAFEVRKVPDGEPAGTAGDGGELAALGSMVAVSSDPTDAAGAAETSGSAGPAGPRTAPWADDVRRSFTTSGALAPELLG